LQVATAAGKSGYKNRSLNQRKLAALLRGWSHAIHPRSIGGSKKPLKEENPSRALHGYPKGY
jgi:hypothetical protein